MRLALKFDLTSEPVFNVFTFRVNKVCMILLYAVPGEIHPNGYTLRDAAADGTAQLCEDNVSTLFFSHVDS